MKHETYKPVGLLQPLPIPHKPWTAVSMDFVNGLPLSQRLDKVMVIVDRPTKYVHFIGLSHPYSTAKVAALFTPNVFKLHDRPTEWSDWLYLAEYWFNTNYHSTTKVTPYEAMYGFPPPCLLDYIPGTTQVATVDSLLQSRQHILTLLKQNLVEVQARMKQQCDLHKSERAFNVLEKIGEVAYRLSLPTDAAIHPVFHVSCLKAKLGHNHVVVALLPSVNSNGILTPKPVAVLQTRSHKLRNRLITQHLIQWQGGTTNDATWEDLLVLQQQFPHLVGKLF
ncbi:uncharacterized protein LOC136064253 [Quercus suber]|uniref:uncharacterized protein LOC136064253 n=1 Tax=Quercus suber TaxID=58331 RepID=UPI0032DE951E